MAAGRATTLSLTTAVQKHVGDDIDTTSMFYTVYGPNITIKDVESCSHICSLIIRVGSRDFWVM